MRSGDWNQLIDWIRQEQGEEMKRRRAEQLRSSLLPVDQTISHIQENARADLRILEQKIKDAQSVTAHVHDLEMENEHLTRELNRLVKIQKKRSAITKKGMQERLELDLIRDRIAEFIVTKSDLKEKVDHVQNDIERLRQEYVAAQKELKDLPAVQKRLIANEFWLAQARKAEQEILILNDDVERLRYKIDHEVLIKRDAQVKRAIEADLTVLDYRAEQHNELKGLIYQLAGQLAAAETLPEKNR